LVAKIIAQPATEFISEEKFEGAKSLQNQFFPLSFKGEGDTGGEVNKKSILRDELCRRWRG